MDGVQSFGEKRVIWRTIGQLCRSGVRSSNESRCYYWPYLPASSPGEYAALDKLAEGEELGSNLPKYVCVVRRTTTQADPFAPVPLATAISQLSHALRLLDSPGYETWGFRSKSWNEFADAGEAKFDSGLWRHQNGL